jgi:hypothetical protein
VNAAETARVKILRELTGCELTDGEALMLSNLISCMVSAAPPWIPSDAYTAAGDAVDDLTSVRAHFAEEYEPGDAREHTTPRLVEAAWKIAAALTHSEYAS